MARSLNGKRKRRSDISSSDDESEEESSDDEKERGTKPAPVANATESTQQKLGRLWVETANAWDCNLRLKHELSKAKDVTSSLISQLRQEKAKQENLEKLIKRKKDQNDKAEDVNRLKEKK